MDSSAHWALLPYKDLHAELTRSYTEYYTQTSWTALGLHYAKLWIMRAGAGKSWQGNCSSALKANGDIAWVLEHRRVLLASLAFVEMRFSCGLRWFIRKAAADLAMWASPKFTATAGHRFISCRNRGGEQKMDGHVGCRSLQQGLFCWRTWCLYNAAARVSIYCSSSLGT